jgi:CheY-like chemotaxis protein
MEFARMLMGAVDKRKADGGPAPQPTVRPASTVTGPKPQAPTPEAPKAEPPKLEPPMPIGDPTGSRVLVIDDDQAIRDMVGQILARENQVYQASDGANALELLKRVGSVDVIVCDVMMPRLDGFEFARAAKADPDLAGIPILFLTARDSAKDHVEGIQAGARSYLTKPFKVKELLAAVKRAARG